MHTTLGTTPPVWGEGIPIPAPLWPPDNRFDDVVVGGGFTGLVTGLLLARAGRSVAVLEARRVGAGASGATTGKVSLLQGTKLSSLLGVHSAKVAQAYVSANRDGQAWLLEFCDRHGVPIQRCDAVTYAPNLEQVSAVRAEYDAARRLGLDVQWRAALDVPFPVHGAALLPDQAQIDPRAVLSALATQFQLQGGRIYEGTRVTGVSKLGEVVVSTEDGRSLRCSDAVLATGAPILDRGLYFAKLEAKRSYLLGFTLAGDVPEQMLISAGSPTRSVRGVPGETSRLLVGGNGHPVGRVRSEAAQLEQLRDWTESHFPGAVQTHAWSAQDHTSHDGIPYAGRLPRGRGRVYVATGYDKWGITNAVAAARTISGEILGSRPSWAAPLGRRLTHPKAALRLVSTNLRASSAVAGALARAELHEVDPEERGGDVGREGLSPVPVAVTTKDGDTCRLVGLCTHLGGTLHWNDSDEERGGDVGREGLSPVPVAVTTKDGDTCRLVGLCTHLGGTLHWNDSENSWDCPWHGSRFAADGAVLEGPATRPLHRRPAHHSDRSPDG